MKLLCLAFTFLLPTLSAFAQEVRQADTLSPEDFGAKKFVFKAQPAKDQVVVFRMEKYIDGRIADRYDRITNERDSKHVVLLLDWSFLDKQRAGEFTIKTAGSTSNFDKSNLVGYEMGSIPPKATFTFRDISEPLKRETKLVFTIFLESYSEAKKRRPDLPADNSPESTWTGAYSDDFTKK